MYEYEIMNKVTKERTFIWGYSWKNALSRNPSINPSEWECIFSEYVD